MTTYDEILKRLNERIERRVVGDTVKWFLDGGFWNQALADGSGMIDPAHCPQVSWDGRFLPGYKSFSTWRTKMLCKGGAI